MKSDQKPSKPDQSRKSPAVGASAYRITFGATTGMRFAAYVECPACGTTMMLDDTANLDGYPAKLRQTWTVSPDATRIERCLKAYGHGHYVDALPVDSTSGQETQ